MTQAFILKITLTEARMDGGTGNIDTTVISTRFYIGYRERDLRSKRIRTHLKISLQSQKTIGMESAGSLKFMGRNIRMDLKLNFFKMLFVKIKMEENMTFRNYRKCHI